MALARITQRFSDEESICVEVQVRDSYPDSVDQCVTEVIRLWREAVPDDASG